MMGSNLFHVASLVVYFKASLVGIFFPCTNLKNVVKKASSLYPHSPMVMYMITVNPRWVTYVVSLYSAMCTDSSRQIDRSSSPSSPSEQQYKWRHCSHSLFPPPPETKRNGSSRSPGKKTSDCNAATVSPLPTHLTPARR